MLIEIIRDPTIKDCDKILNVLFDVGFATKEQLAELFQWNIYKVQNELRNVSKQYEKTKKWIDYVSVHSKSVGQPKRAYCLTPYAINKLRAVRGVDAKLRPPISIQLNHYLGITDILIRVLKKVKMEHWTKLEWWAEYEARTYIIQEYLKKYNSVSSKPITPYKLATLVQPDGYLRIIRQPFWIEFDNNTERRKKLEERYMNYVKTMFPKINGHSMKLNMDFPIIWVTKTQTRKQSMERLWMEVKDKCRKDFRNPRSNLPNMYFFVEGEETHFLLDFALNQDAIKTVNRGGFG